MTTIHRKILFAAVLVLPVGQAVHAQPGAKALVWLTDPGASVLFQQQAGGSWEKAVGKTTGPVITIDGKRSYQSIDGFGWALTDGSADHIIAMSPDKRTALLQDLFRTDGTHIGGSYLRVSIGASDLSDHPYSYDDVAGDTSLQHFDLGPQNKNVLPVLKEILRINPHIKILGSPWSPPAWMKSNQNTKGGSLLPQYYPVYARYFVKYILAMRHQGIVIDAITVQNEPLHPGNNPSLLLQATEEGEFIKHHLGPAFRMAGIKTKIILYDHNADRPDYPLSILKDPAARPFVDGSAFHLYGGKIEALTPVHDSFPDKNLYFTEQWVGEPGDMNKDIREHIHLLIIGAVRNWCKNVIEWNLAANSQWQPHTVGGCDQCLGAVTIDGNTVKRNPAYYIVAHAAKYVRPGSVRIASNSDENLPNVAFRTPDNKIVLVVLNNSNTNQSFTIGYNGRQMHPSLHAGAVATYVW